MTNQFLRFGLVGVAGYVVDSGVLYAALGLGLGTGSGRLVSFLCAVLATWLLNRRFTFAPSPDAPGGQSLLQESLKYLAAMSVGGVLNLCTYALIMASLAYHPALPALAVAAGSLVGMLANFAGAKWWVYRGNLQLLPANSPARNKRGWRLNLSRRDLLALVAVQLLFWLGHFHHMELPGLYMDAVNPDYMAARTLNPLQHNPVFAMPTALFPILGSPYHGVQNYYVGIPVFALLGFNMLALRIAQGLFGAGILVALFALTKRVTGSTLLAFMAAAGLATELAFLASFRTQNYIVISGCLWLLCSVYCAVPRSDGQSADHPLLFGRRHLVSGVCAGLAVYSYFVYLFFVPAFLILGFVNTRNWRSLWSWGIGFALGMMTYVAGYASLIIALNGWGPAVTWFGNTFETLAPMSSRLSMVQSVESAWLFMRLAVENTSNEWMIFGTQIPGDWSLLKRLVLLCCVAVVMVSGWATRRVGTPSHSNDQALLHPWQLAWLPVSFFACALYFGGRLGGHHFSSLVPLLYLFLALACRLVMRSTRPVLFRYAVCGILAALVLANWQQQSAFFTRLEETGGVGKFSNAINRMSEDALSLPIDVVHVFPEWGFMMPFGFLTANQRPYTVDMSPQSLSHQAEQGKKLRLFYWKPEDAAKYRYILESSGLKVTEVGAYFQRDQQPAFAWMQAARK